VPEDDESYEEQVQHKYCFTAHDDDDSQADDESVDYDSVVSDEEDHHHPRESQSEDHKKEQYKPPPKKEAIRFRDDVTDNERQQITDILLLLGIDMKLASDETFLNDIITHMVMFHSIAIRNGISITSPRFRYLLKRIFCDYIKTFPFYGNYFYEMKFLRNFENVNATSVGMNFVQRSKGIGASSGMFSSVVRTSH
jgi:hypothetical protein